jgi:hypothetical protein
MPQSKVEWKVLRGAIGIFSICLLIGGMLLGASYHFREEMEAEYRDHHARFRDVSRKYLAVDDEERIIEHHYPVFLQLYESGILGREHRLSWLESLRSAGDRIPLPELSYRINPQTVYEPEFPVVLGAFELYVSEMDLSLGLLHEGDLLALLDTLNRNAQGLYSVSRCEAHRVNEESEFDPRRPTITAACRLSWFTIDLKGERRLSL